MYKQNWMFFYRNDYDENSAKNYRVVNIKFIYFIFYIPRSLFFKRLANNKGPIRLTTVVWARTRLSYIRFNGAVTMQFVRIRVKSKTVLCPFFKHPVEDVRTLIFFVPNDSLVKKPCDIGKLCVFLIRLEAKIVFRKITPLYSALLSATNVGHPRCYRHCTVLNFPNNHEPTC